MVAAAVLLSGLLGVVSLIDTANATDSTTKAREQGVALAREVIESGRSIPYAQMTPASIVGKVQSMAGLQNANAGPGWTVQRRGVTYGVAIGVCSVDDPSDGYGQEDPNFACADNVDAPSVKCSTLLGTSGSVAGDSSVVSQYTGTLAGQRAIGDCGLDISHDGRVDDLTQADAAGCASGACQNTPIGGDSSPDDYKRLIVLVTWTTGRPGYVLETSLIDNPGTAAGPSASSIALSPGFNNGSSTVTDPTVTSVPFSVAADSNTVAAQWSLNGTPQGSATNSGGSWTFSWSIGTSGSGNEVLDGNYTIGVIPFDSQGNAGTERSMTVTLNRRAPYAPNNFGGGRNGTIADFQWAPNKEGDIVGYQVYRIAGAGQPDVMVCSTSNARNVACQDNNPPAGASLQYYAVALDTSPQGGQRAGDHSTTLTVTNTNQAPNAPTNLQASSSNGNTVLLWTAPVDPDGDPIDFYRIYRDGQAVGNRYDTAPGNATSYTDTNTGGVSHTYWVTAVDPQLAESLAATITH